MKLNFYGRFLSGIALSIFAFASSFSSSAIAEAESDLVRIGQSREWKGLLQYQKNFLGSESSEVAANSFFLSNEGRNDPVKELRATLVAFHDPKLTDAGNPKYSHPICLFPARFQFLVSRLHLDVNDFPRPSCKEYAAYRSRLQTDRVSIVFSSYYTGSASSVFGHSFLRFGGRNDNELFDTGINFAANPTTENPILYALYGIIGVFPATFSAQPFYYKVREYNDYEARDLWTYELSLTLSEKSFLLDHLWELGNVYYDYYYFNQNCSYQIMRAIEGAVPRLHFWSHRPLYLIPSDSIKTLNQVPGLIQKISFRPSIRSSAFERFRALSEPDKSAVLMSLQSKRLPVEKKSSAPLLDTLIDAIDLNYAKELANQPAQQPANQNPSIVQYKRAVLEKRASIPEISPNLIVPVPTSESPEKGHGSARTTLSFGKDYVDLDVRASHHDLLDPSIGYPEFLHIDFGRIGGRFRRDDHRFELKEVTIVNLTALSIEHPLYSHWSYEGHLGFDRDIFDRPVLEVRAGIGKAYPFFKDHAFIAMVDVAPEYSSQYANSRFRFLIEPSLKLLFELDATTKLFIQAFGGAETLSKYSLFARGSIAVRHVFHSTWGLGGSSETGVLEGNHFDQWAFKFFYYF